MCIETIVFDLEKTLVQAFYKGQINDYDEFTLIQIFGNSKVKVRYL